VLYRRLIVLLVVAAAVAPAAHAGTISVFFYPWYGTPAVDGAWEHWDEGGHSAPADIAAADYPARGVYSSSDPAVLRAQMAEIARSGIDEVVSSWWGWGSPEDLRLPLVIAAARAQQLRVAVHIEPYPGRTLASLSADIDHLRSLGITRFFVYHPWDVSDAAGWAAWRDGETGISLFAQTTLVGRAAAARFDGVYTYDILVNHGEQFARLCSEARRVRLVCLPSVGPGYDASRATGDSRVKPRRQGATYDAMWRSAIAAGADGITITSYNEWHEGTQIEPAETFSGPGRAQIPYADYDGAYGLQGRAAEGAYLLRTAYWAGIWHARGLLLAVRKHHS
jgi:hypothetical protein